MEAPRPPSASMMLALGWGWSPRCSCGRGQALDAISATVLIVPLESRGTRGAAASEAGDQLESLMTGELSAGDRG